MRQLVVLSLEELRAVGVGLAKIIKTSSIIALDGPLGSGKTQLTKYIITQLLGHKIDVPSPTFTILQRYEVPRYEVPLYTVFHCDFYRLQTYDEIRELGLEEEIISNVCIMEWSSLAKPLTDIYKTIFVNISFVSEKPSARNLILTSNCPQLTHILTNSHFINDPVSKDTSTSISSS